MSLDKPIRRIAIVGTGVIGASWAAQYLARGFDVVATDPAPNAEANLRKYVDDAWGELEAIGLSLGATRPAKGQWRRVPPTPRPRTCAGWLPRSERGRSRPRRIHAPDTGRPSSRR